MILREDSSPSPAQTLVKKKNRPHKKESIMQKTPELAHLLEGRGNLYRFLSRFYLTEVDEAFWTAIRGMTFTDTAD